MSQPQYDVIVFGATSFVGQIVCQYLTDHFNTDGTETLKWAIAGRCERKLNEVKQKTGGCDLAVLVADAAEEQALRTMCGNTKVVISTVGPYALYGEPLVKACAETGTDYCDLTAEVQWIKRMLDKYETTAQHSSARIVHCSGFDSIPSDMGVYFTQQQAQQSLGTYCNHIKMRVKTAKGGLSGGTAASIVNIIKEAVKDPGLRKRLGDPYLLCPKGHGYVARQVNTDKPTLDGDFNTWIAPFVMAPINTKVVFRSNALAGGPYGSDFKYDEAMLVGKGFKGRITATAIAAAWTAFLVGAAIQPTRWLLEKYVLPKPGQGPSQKTRRNGYYDLRFVGKTADGQEIRTKVTGQGDPGYDSTSKMLVQVGACLAMDMHKDSTKPATAGGFWTTSTLFGNRLIERLREHAKMTFEVL